MKKSLLALLLLVSFLCVWASYNYNRVYIDSTFKIWGLLRSFPGDQQTKENIRQQFAIVMLRREDADLGESLLEILPVINRGDPLAVVLDLDISLTSEDEMAVSEEKLQLAFDAIGKKLVWVYNEENEGIKKILRNENKEDYFPLGFTNIITGKIGAIELTLFEPCKVINGVAVPHLVVLAWEISRGLYSLPYHTDCKRWEEEYLWLPKIDVGGAFYIPVVFFGKNNFFKKISDASLLDGTTNSEELRGKIVLVGTTRAEESGHIDKHILPNVGEMDGTEILANAIATIISVASQ